MKWNGLFYSRQRRYADVSESIQEHLQEKIDEFMEDGMTRDEAESAARREFGNVDAIHERSREVWQRPTIQSILADIKYSFRQIGRAPGFAAVVIIILALGVGANTTVFSIVDAVMLRPLPYSEPQRLVEVKSSQGDHFETENVSYPDFFDWRTQNHSFQSLVSYHDVALTLTGIPRAQRLDGQIVSKDFLPLLGISPEIGRGFTPDEETVGARVILISDALWRSQFGADHSVLGRSINLNGNPFTVIGVMPPSFRFPVTRPKTSFWTTLAVDGGASNSHSLLTNRSVHFVNVIGRLKPGISVAQANVEMRSIAARLAKEYPDSNSNHSQARVEPELESILGNTKILLLVVLGSVLLVLLLACANIANLLLAKVKDRQREIAVRAALGAAPHTLVRQLLTENLLQGALGGLAGCILAFVCTPFALRLIGDSVPRAVNAGVNLTVLGFGLVLSLFCGVLFGLVPALTAVRTDLVTTLKEGGRSNLGGHDKLRSILLIGQVALGVLLTAGAGLLINSFHKLSQTNNGFDSDHVLTFTFDLSNERYKDTRQNFYRRFFEKVRAVPGVESAGGSVFFPLVNDLAVMSFRDPEHPASQGQQSTAGLSVISTDFFRTMGVPVLKGRDFTDADDLQAPETLVVNQAFVERYFHGEDVLGKDLTLGIGIGNGKPGGAPSRRIVGVVGNMRQSATQREMMPAMYVPAAQVPAWCCLHIAVSSSVDPLSLEPDVRRIVSSMDPDIPVTDVHSLKDLLSQQLSQPRFAMLLLGSFAGLALVLTVVGLYGTMTYSVSRRTREIGVRLALGAQRQTILWMVLRNAAGLLAVGTGLGILASLLSATVLSSMLYGVAPRDPAVLSLVSFSVVFIGLLAAYIPAFRAASINPAKTLRGE